MRRERKIKLRVNDFELRVPNCVIFVKVIYVTIPDKQ